MKKINFFFKITFIFASLLLVIVLSSITIVSGEITYQSLSDSISDNNYALDRVLIVINSSESAKLNDYSPADFPETDVIEVKELTSETKAKRIEERNKGIAGNSVGSDLEDGLTSGCQNFNQILSLTLKTSGKESVLAAIESLKGREDITYVGPDYQLFPEVTIPDDTHYTEQWGLDKICAENAWDITTGSSSVIVGVIDSGIDGTHPDLSDRINSSLNRDFTNGTCVEVTTPSDPFGHGTAVAGVIGAHGDNTTGVCGVCWNVSLVSLRVLDSGGNGFSSRVVMAIDFASANGIPILNISLGWYDTYISYDQAMDTAIANYWGLVVCSAGNDAKDTDIVNHYPSIHRLSNLISVTYTTRYDELDYYLGSDGFYHGSNYGATTVHLCAPGTSIKTCSIGIDGYSSPSGTSVAAPHVTGVAALIKSIRPDLSAVEIKNIILNNVDKVTALNGKCVTGGRLNAYKAVRAATEPQTFAGDVNGDGRADIILSRGVNGQRALTVYLGQSDGSFSEPVTKQSTRTFVYTDPAFVGDFNGDGRTDLLVHWVYNGYRQLLIYTGRSNGSFHEAVNLSSTRIHNEQSYPCSLHVGDVNGDGKDDFIVHYRSSNGYRRALVYKGSAASPYIEDASSTALTSTNLYGFNTPVFVGDFNGDGRSDMLVHWSYDGYRQLLIYTGKSDGSFNSGVNTSSGHAHNPSDHPCQFFVDDVNADGKDDFIVHWKSQNGYRRNLVYKGKSASNYITEGVSSITSYTCPYVYDEDVLLGDVNGDDYIDMIVQRANSSGKREFLIFSANSDGTYNNDVTLTTNNTHDPTVYAGRALTADVNGDGKDDFIVKWMYNAQWNRFLTYKGTASSPYLLSTPVSTSPSTNVYYYNADSN